MNEKKNINMNTEQALVVCEDVLRQANQDGRRMYKLYVADRIGAVLFEGDIALPRVKAVTEVCLKAGASHSFLADTIGAAIPSRQ